METIHHVIEWAALGIEMLAAAVIVATVVIMAVTRRNGAVFCGRSSGASGNCPELSVVTEPWQKR